MRVLLVASTLAFSTTLTAATHAITGALPNTTPPPTTFLKRDLDSASLSCEMSEALASATSALAEHPTDAPSIYSGLREQYGIILDDATGCDSSRWARVTNAVGEFREDPIDGILNVADEIFGDDDDDECGDTSRREENSGLKRSTGVAYFAAVGAVLLAITAML